MLKMKEPLKIYIKKGQEYQAKREPVYLPSLFFGSAYEQARDCLEEIETICEQFEQNPANGHSYSDGLQHIPDGKLYEGLLGYSNNVIAFCADRGYGKTTAMLSFGEALKSISKPAEPDLKEAKKRFWQMAAGPIDLTTRHYEVLSSVDPTMMENESSILWVILCRMLTCFLETWNERYHDHYLTAAQKQELTVQRQDLLESFQKCLHSIDLLHQQRKNDAFEEEDELTRIIETSDSCNLRGMLYRLFSKYLAFSAGSAANVRDSYLVLQIDDADLQIANAYHIIEDIRKYLLLPHVVVLMAVNMNELESTLEQHFLEQYATSIERKGMVDIMTCHDIAERYIDKVIPGSRQIHLPELRKALNENFGHIQIHYTNAVNGKLLLTDAAADGSRTWFYQEQLLYLLHQKTGMLFLHPKNFLHNILPRSMRELTHFLTYFGKMQDVNATYYEVIESFIFRVNKNNGKSGVDADPVSPETLALWRHNLDLFERYLVDPWAAVNLRENGRTLLRTFSRENSDNKHRYLLKALPNYYGREMAESGDAAEIKSYAGKFRRTLRQRSVELHDDEVSDSNQSNNADPPDPKAFATPQEHTAYVDVLEALNTLAEMPGFNRQYPLIYALRLYYSIHMHQLLLDQLETAAESAGKDDNKENSLVAMLKNILFRMGERDGLRKEGLPFSFLQVDPVRLYDFYSQNRNTSLMNAISLFCRVQKEHVRSFRMEKIDFKTLQGLAAAANQTASQQTAGASSAEMAAQKPIADQGDILFFNIFYPLLRQLENLVSDPHSSEASLLRSALIILLNWDVQYDILRKLKDPSPDKSYKPSLYDQVNYFYGQAEDISRILRRAVEFNYNEVAHDEDHPILFFTDPQKGDPGAWQISSEDMYAIELSCEALRKKTEETIIQNCIEDVNKWQQLETLEVQTPGLEDCTEALQTLRSIKKNISDYNDYKEAAQKIKSLQAMVDSESDFSKKTRNYDQYADNLEEKMAFWGREISEMTGTGPSARDEDPQ